MSEEKIMVKKSTAQITLSQPNGEETSRDVNKMALTRKQL